MNTTMKALVCRKLGDPTVPMNETSPIMVSTDHPLPKLTSPLSVIVRVRAASVNYATVLQMMGKYQDKIPPPYVPGADFSGVVEAVGHGVTTLKVGDHVCGLAREGTFAEKIVIDETDLFVVPKGCDLVAAAGLPIAFGTSHCGLVYRAGLTAGQVLLVLGAAGGVGASAVQIGKVYGATVIAVAWGKEKEQFLKSLGADHVVDSASGNLISDVKSFLKSRNLKGVDVLYDPVGGNLLKDSLKVLNWGAQILIIGFASGEIPVIPANITLVKNWTVHGFFLGNYHINNPEALVKSMHELISWLERGVINVNVSHQFSLSQTNVALAMVMQRKAIGKVMIVFDSQSNDNTSLSKL